MDEIYSIFIGPSKQFQNKLEREVDMENVFYLRELVLEMDSNNFNKWIKEKSNQFSTLICNAESFSSVREHFVSNLPYLLKILVDHGCINKCYFQNPPLSFVKGLKRVVGENLTEENHEYEKITRDHLLSIYKIYNEEIIGQNDTLIEILSTLYPLTAVNSEKPVVIMFYGPAGVGKTESAKLINNVMTKGELFRQQLSMFQTGDFGSYLFGSSLEHPALARDLLNRESNVILFDEFNRCSSAVHSAFFQMFDEGIFVDKNYEVNLKNSVIICTANYESREEIFSALGGPLFSRFDHFIHFNYLSIDAKKTLIKEKYLAFLDQWTGKEKEILGESNHIEKLIKDADFFTNARNIEKGVKGYMSKVLTKYMIEENIEVKSDSR